jgi:hypothetical protein
LQICRFVKPRKGITKPHNICVLHFAPSGPVRMETHCDHMRNGRIW